MKMISGIAAAPAPLLCAYLLTFSALKISTVQNYFRAHLFAANKFYNGCAYFFLNTAFRYKQVFELLHNKRTSQAIHRFFIFNFSDSSIVYSPVFWMKTSKKSSFQGLW